MSEAYTTFEEIHMYLFDTSAPDDLVDAMRKLENEFHLLQEAADKLQYVREVIDGDVVIPY